MVNGGALSRNQSAREELSDAAIQRKELAMPFLIPVLIGVPVVLGSGWVIYHFIH